MPTTQLAPSRAAETNPNHHLWKNGRLWWLAVTLLHDGWRQERIRQSLGTDDLSEAKRKEDPLLAAAAGAGPGADGAAGGAALATSRRKRGTGRPW